MIHLYKLDKSECVKHLATSEGVSTAYTAATQEAIKKAAAARKKSRAAKIKSTSDPKAIHGPPDRLCHIQKQQKK